MYDRTVMANQAWDNSNTALAKGVVDARNNRLTNAVNTYNINTTNPNFQIDTTTGGKVYFHRGTKLEPGQSPDFASTFANLRSNKSLSMLDSQTLANIASQQMGLGSVAGKKSNAASQAQANQQYLDMYGQIYPGQVGPPQGT
jgi:hypothetical protein